MKIYILAAQKGLLTPNLPEEILKFQLHPIIRVLRVLGGLSTLFLITDRVQQYSLPIYYYIIAMIITFMFFIYHMYITYHRIKHIRYLLKSDKLDIKNSPLDHLARLSARLILCAKGVCDQAQPIGVAMGIMLGIDTALEKADQKAIFGPILGSALKTVLPNREVKEKVSDLIIESVDKIDKNNQEIQELNSIIDKVSNWSNTNREVKKDVS